MPPALSVKPQPPAASNKADDEAFDFEFEADLQKVDTALGEPSQRGRREL